MIVSAVRTPIGSFGGALKDKTAVELATLAVKEAIKRAGIDAKTVEEVILGCVGQYGVNGFLARLAALHAGCDESSAALTVNRLCASGLQGIVSAAQAIERGDAEITVGGGAESMSNFPYLLRDARWGMRMGVAPSGLEDALTTALCEPFTGVSTHIAVTAEAIAERCGLAREELDAYAFASQEKALAAIEKGRFRDEIVPVPIRVKKEETLFDTDEYPRATSLDKLAKLKPFAKADGMVTAGNASGINDGAAAMVLMSEEKARELGLKPIARLVASACAGVDPQYMGMGPVPATRKLLKKTGIAFEDIGLVELNEAFASQALACIRELGLRPEIVNVNGSGISLGHPIGATGAAISVKLLWEMGRRDIRYGLATLCIGGGQGMAALFERMEG